MNPVTLYILAYLRDLGETWTETNTSDPDHGTIRLRNAAGERLTFSHRINNGDPQWFLTRAPRRYTTELDGLYPLRSPPKRDT